MVRVSSPAKLRPWSELTAKMVMGVVPGLVILENPKLKLFKPTPNPEIPKNHRVYMNFFEKFARTFAFFPVTRIRNPTEIVQKNLFRRAFLFWVDFFWVGFHPLNFLWFGMEFAPSKSLGKKGIFKKFVMFATVRFRECFFVSSGVWSEGSCYFPSYRLSTMT